MLGVFFLVVWISVIAALTNNERQRSARLLLQGRLDDDYKDALRKGDHQALVLLYRAAIMRGLSAVDEQLVRINLACAYNGLTQHHKALEELDRVSVRQLTPNQVALWLNNRAYTLALLGRPAESLEHLADADALLQGDDGLLPDASLLACLSGTRGIALHGLGRGEEAEAALQDALRLEEQSRSSGREPDLMPSPARTAERWWWLSEVAAARGDTEEARVRLGRAAAQPNTEYGARAAHQLEGAGLLAVPDGVTTLARTLGRRGEWPDPA